MERITVLAIDGIASDAEPERLDSDWLTHFYERGRLISDTEMQALWARLLAGQANSPGRFSRRTVDLLYTMDKSDAQAFEQLCRFNWLFGKDELVPLVLNLSGPETAIYSTAGVTFETLIHLDSIGLITFDAIGEYSLTLPAGEFLTFHWSDKTLVGVEIPRAGAEDDSTFIGVGHALFTRVGKELASLVECDPVDGFCQHVVSKWGEYGYKTMVRVAVRVDESGATSA